MVRILTAMLHSKAWESITTGAVHVRVPTSEHPKGIVTVTRRTIAALKRYGCIEYDNTLPASMKIVWRISPFGEVEARKQILGFSGSF